MHSEVGRAGGDQNSSGYWYGLERGHGAGILCRGCSNNDQRWSSDDVAALDGFRYPSGNERQSCGERCRSDCMEVATGLGFHPSRSARHWRLVLPRVPKVRSPIRGSISIADQYLGGLCQRKSFPKHTNHCYDYETHLFKRRASFITSTPNFSKSKFLSRSRVSPRRVLSSLASLSCSLFHEFAARPRHLALS